MSQSLLELAKAAASEPVSPILHALRRQGATEFARLGFPHTKNEDWLYTNTSEISTGKYTRDIGGAVVPLNDLAPFLFGNESWPRVVIVDGQFSADLSELNDLPDGVRVQSLHDAARDESDVLTKYLGNIVPASRDGFTALNASSAGTGVVVHVAKEMVSDIPLHILHVTTANANGVLAQPRHLIVVERHGKATVVESFVSLGEAQTFTNSVTEVVVEDGATLTHLRVQR
ncbi:MAG: SufD family Fe-S cluster assembly protein, partial [Gemmatimonadaceae bacterium]